MEYFCTRLFTLYSKLEVFQAIHRAKTRESALPGDKERCGRKWQGFPGQRRQTASHETERVSVGLIFN